MAQTGKIRKRRQQRARAKAKTPISAVKTRPREDPMRVALEARQRVYGVSAADAGQPEAGSVLGRLKLAGTITDTMYEAGKRYLELYQAYLKALKAPTGLAKGGGSANEAEASDDYVDWAIRAVAHYEVMKAALNDQGLAYRVSVDLIVLRDCETSSYLRDVLVAGALPFLARKMGLENMPRAA